MLISASFMTALRAMAPVTAYCCLVFLYTGGTLPFMGLWFESRGLNSGQISLILALPMLARVVTGPLIAAWADSFRLRRTPLALLALGAWGMFALMAMGPEGPEPPVAWVWLWLGLWVVGAGAMSAIIPLTDVLILRQARDHGFDYAFSRGTASIAFILANLVVGGLIAWSGPGVVMVWVLLAVAVLGAAGVLLLPPEPVLRPGEADPSADPEVARRRFPAFAALKALISKRVFLGLILCAGLIQASHGFYYSFGSIVWNRQGLSAAIIGWLWGFGVMIEVLFMWFGARFQRLLGGWGLVMLGGAGAVFRWTVMAFSPPLWALWPLQALHALSFAAAFIGSIKLIEALARPDQASAAQSLSSALSAGLLIGLATLASGHLFAAYGSGGYLAMAGMAFIGTIGTALVYRQQQARAS